MKVVRRSRQKAGHLLQKFGESPHAVGESGGQNRVSHIAPCAALSRRNLNFPTQKIETRDSCFSHIQTKPMVNFTGKVFGKEELPGVELANGKFRILNGA